MRDDRCISACAEKERLAIRHGLCAVCSDELRAKWRHTLAERDRLRSALAALVGASTRDELEQLEVGMRMMPAPAEDKAVSIDAIHALIATAE